MDLVSLLETHASTIDEYDILPASMMPEKKARFYLCQDNTKLAINIDAVADTYKQLSLLFLPEKTNFSSSTEAISTALLLLNPDFLSAWNYRKRFIIHKSSKDWMKRELKLTSLILLKRPKSQLAWYHR